MEPVDVSNFIALTLLLIVAGVVAAMLHPVSRDIARQSASSLIALTALGATAGSLYFSEVADFVPCSLCWYQRTAMYPLALLAPVALVVKDRTIWRTSLLLGIVGLAIAVYHVQLELFPEQSSVCALDNPCTARWVEALGVLTIPRMAALCFALIVGLSLLARSPAQGTQSVEPSR